MLNVIGGIDGPVSRAYDNNPIPQTGNQNIPHFEGDAIFVNNRIYEYNHTNRKCFKSN